jgi:hypothetical protein
MTRGCAFLRIDVHNTLVSVWSRGRHCRSRASNKAYFPISTLDEGKCVHHNSQ